MSFNNNNIIQEESILNSEIKNKGFMLLDSIFKQNEWYKQNKVWQKRV